jgi:transcriptional regulator with XRE-family HTH domain
MTKLGVNIIKYRVKRGMTQRELAAKCAIHESYLSRIEGGGIENPGINVVRDIAAALTVTIDELNK